MKPKTHENAEKALVSAGNSSSYLVRRGDSSKGSKIATAEAARTYHSMRHSQSFCANDCLSTLLKHL